ncbi:hypothetical protein Ssi03_07750 [Sphaerisporangium siamense]|uniref:DUF5753 domain-containing protein n=1 Tax=Sphaerisporangium siamense TaxID=795645 RepID=A0A7W7DFF7_9ACTN|nr:DUF5753 domain-containing protein [Sphaerisporangium siamense]MBB4705823.1 hypothetical protein [Sphaerisporangium siamense]GII82785.1 hypothetical protein Ssi03_07750 [Sphaerisporangium siamense]
MDNAWLESRAEVIRSFDAMVVPGLLQTREYMESVMRAADSEAPDEQIRRWIEFRLIRQQVLASNMPRVVVVLDEAVLHRSVGGNETMRAQFTRLVDVARQPNIDLRVLSRSSGAHASPDGSFKVYEMPEPYPVVAHVPSPAGPLYVEADQAERLMLKFDAIRRDALPGAESVELIKAVAQGRG